MQDDPSSSEPPVDASRAADADGAGVLPDGTYDVFVVDAEPLGIEGDGRGYRLELTVVAGAHKGEVLGVTAAGLRDELFDLIGMPGTLTVAGGAPAVHIDR